MIFLYLLHFFSHWMRSIVTAKPLDTDIPLSQRIEADVQWARVVRLELVPHPGVEHPEAIEADYQMKDGVLVLDMRAPLVGYALRRWAVDCSLEHSLNPKEHQLRLKNLQTLYGVESAALAPGYLVEETSDESL
jgi:hypothetical protein